jgi:hypothetical protein
VAFALRSRGFTVSGFQLLGFLSLSLTLCLSLQLFRKIWDFFCFVQARCTHTARGKFWIFFFFFFLNRINFINGLDQTFGFKQLLFGLILYYGLK